MSEIDKTIKGLEYAKHLLGLPEQGTTWKANAETIAIDKAIQTLQEKQELEWIPVSERLPENKIRVLVTRAIGIIDIGYCNRNSNDEWRDSGGYKADIPKAWQLLPEPYKEVQP